MTGDQLAVLVVLVLAFAAGWYARGESGAQKAPRRDGADLVGLLGRGGEALSRVLTASRATVAMWRVAGTEQSEAGATAVAILSTELGRLREVAAEVGRRLGYDNPLSVDIAQAVEAATLIEGELDSHFGREDLTDDRARSLNAYEGVLADARTRYARGVEVVRPLHETDSVE